MIINKTGIMMRTKISYSVTLTVAALLLFAGCSVLEDRTPCPCYLTLDWRRVKAADPSDGRDGAWECRVLVPEVAHDVRYSPFEAPDLEIVPVKKSAASVVAVFHDHPLKEALEHGMRLEWPAGNQIDSVYAFKEDVDCTGEDAVCVLEPHKQFSTITFDDGLSGAELSRYNLVVRGTTDGFDASTFAAIEGEYLADVQERPGASADAFSVRIPRQTSPTLVLEFWTKDSKLRLFSSPVGAYLFAMGYDRDEADLRDYHIRVDFRQALMFIRIADWEDEYVYSLY